MKCEFYVCCTSGIQGPTLELTQEQAQKIVDFAMELSEPWTSNEFSGSRLGPDHFMVCWTDTNAPILGLSTNITGYVSIWKQGDTDWRKLRDTVGLWTHLAQYGSHAYQTWLNRW